MIEEFNSKDFSALLETESRILSGCVLGKRKMVPFIHCKGEILRNLAYRVLMNKLTVLQAMKTLQGEIDAFTSEHI